MIAWVAGGIGAILAVAGGIVILIQAFRTDLLWGLACLLVPIATLVFVIMYWDRAKRGALAWIPGTLLFCAAVGTIVIGQKQTVQVEEAQKRAAVQALQVEYERQEAELRTERDLLEANGDGGTLRPRSSGSSIKECNCPPGDPLCACL
jgi:Ca2+/Na+ antiporter